MSGTALGMSRYILCLGLSSLILSCLAEESVEDGVVECATKVSRALLTFEAEGDGQVQFEFKYLIGAKDNEGIKGFDWTFHLIDPERREFGSVTQLMREPELEKTLIYVQGKKPRTLPVVVPDNHREGPFVLWIEVAYKGENVAEYFLELEPGVEHVDDKPISKLLMFSQGS